MKKLYFDKMNDEELKKVFDSCASLRDRLYCDIMDSYVYFLINDYMKNFPGRYEVGGYCDYVEINDSKISDFKAWLDDVQKDYYFLSDEEETIARKFISLAEHFDDVMYTLSDENYCRIEARVEELEEEVEKIILSRLQIEIDEFDDPKHVFEYSLEMEWLYNENMYIYSCDYSKVFEHIEYEKAV